MTYRKTQLANKINEIKKLISDNVYHPELNDDDFFYFNINFDENDQPIIGNGSDNSHLNIMVSSKNLLNNLQCIGVNHLDGTYKITTNGFPLVVYGVSDIQGHFHPICFMLTSHETETDFKYFFDGLIKQAEIMNIEYYPDYIIKLIKLHLMRLRNAFLIQQC